MGCCVSDNRLGSGREPTVLMLLVALMMVCLVNCAGIADKSRVEQFGRAAKAYEWAIESADYRAAAKHLDRSAARAPIDFQRYANFRVAQYTITYSRVSDDHRSVRQEVELQYYLVNQSIVKTIVDRQMWRYNETSKKWMLQTGLPVFHR